MQKINQNTQKATKILKNISKEISLLIKENETNSNYFENIKKNIKIVRVELNKIEDIYSSKTNIDSDNSNYIRYSEEKDLYAIEIKKQIIIKKKKVSKSFFSWIFNNSDL